MRWQTETYVVETAPVRSATFYRAYAARHGAECSLVIGPTTDGRFQVRSGSHKRSTLDIAELGDFHGTHHTVTAAKRAARGWLDGV